MLIEPTPFPLIERQIGITLSNPFLSSSNGNTGGTGGGTTSGNDGTTSGGGGTTTTPTTTSPTSTSPTTSPTSTRSDETTTRTSSTQSTFVTSATSNGVVVQTTVTTAQAVTVVETTPASSPTSKSTNKSSSSSNGGLIGGVVGGVVGGLALLTILALIALLWRRRKARTGHGWFLCLGRKPERRDGLDVDWPTFDPSSGAAGVGGTLGEETYSGRRSSAFNHGTLPTVEDGEGGYHYDDMRSTGGATSVVGAGAYPTSDVSNQQYHQTSPQWGISPMASYSQAHQSNPSHYESPQTAPDYSHLDAPEVREQRIREQQALAAAAAAANGHSPPPTGTSSPPMYSPMMNSGTGNVDHRLSQGTAQMLADNNFFMNSGEEPSGTFYNDENNRQRLQLHNPDGS